MAASKASPSTTTTVSVSSSTSSSSSSSSTTNNTSLTTTTTSLTATPDICHNFHELCRSCGKTNDQLYDLFQSPQSSSSPFNTSSTTCYTHLNNSCTSSTSLATATNKTSTTAVGNNCAKTATTTLDTVAATAKASAKGQSNMDNILQEMQIWQLMIKCNDGLPQRICAKCTAQFYMIHKFRRKCLKVQTQLRALNEEQKIYERQQESNEKNETKTETTETEAIGIAIEQSEPTLQLAEAKAVKPCELLKNQDLVNDKPSEQEQQQQQQQQEQEAALIQTKSSSSSSTSVSFETIAGNTNKDCKVATLLDNNAVETMPKQTTPTSSALAVNDKTFETHDQGTLTRLKHKDEKKPLLKAAVLNSIRPSSALTLQQPLEQICDNEALEGDALANANKKLCLDQEDLLAAHVIFKTTSSTTTTATTNNSKQSTDSNEENPNTRSDELKRKTPELKLTQDSAFSKTQTESLFLTKAALKAYTIPHTSTTERIIENVTNSEAKSNNDNNNNAHLCDNNSELNDNTCSSTSSSLTPSSSSSTSSKSSSSLTKLYRTKVLRHKIVKYVAYSSGSSSGRRSGYCSKSKKTLVNQSEILVGKRKQRSWKNKHKLKRLNAMRTCASPASQVELKQQIKNLQIEDETSSTVSTISSTTSSSSSLTTTTAIITTTTPAVSNLVGGNLENIKSSSYCKNAIETGCPSIEGISSNKSCLMWKTKAAMKANANDMPEDIVHVKNNVKALSNITAISLPHTATETPLTGSACLATETDTSSKTLNENQSSVSSSHNNNNNILMEEYCLTNKALTSTDNQVKDTEDESTPNLNNNLWPEEADQKQIKANKPNENAINENSPKEFINCNKNKEEDEDESKELREKHEEQEKGAVVLTPPAKVGCMKLIIQRKRGARFKCRRKEEDDDETTSTHDNLEPTTPKRRRKTSTNTNLKTKLEMESLFSLQHKENDELKHSNEEEYEGNCDIIKNVSRKVPEFNSEEDENKENPIDIENHHDFDSDSNVSVYRDPLLTRNEMLEEDTHLTDFPKPQLSLQTECSKEMYKLYKEKANLESPKKLIVRVPLTSLTQDFKRMHLTMDQENQDNDMENDSSQHKDQHNQTQNELNEQESKEQTFSLQNLTEQEEKLSSNQLNSSQSNISSGQSDLLGFSQNTEASSSTEESSQKEVEMVRYVEPPLCSASSKINDFINDFQNNCIDSSEIDESCDMVPHLGPQINQELSDEIRDVEDTLNGILSEMHDKDMYTPRSGETDEFFAHSVYSPLTDSPTTPAHSFYAESPCTINSNPMSVSPFIHQNMDYNAMTPQSNHSSMGHSSSHMGSGSGSGGSSSSHAGVFSEHFPTYNECFEETTQSELIGFQNDIPCFENIEINNNPGNNNEFVGNQGEYNEEEEVNQMPTATNANICPNNVQGNDEVKTGGEIVDYIDLSDYKENSEDYVATQTTQVSAEMDQQQQTTNTELLPNQVTYQAATYQPSIQMQNTANNMPTQPHYIVTNTNQGPILIANPHINQTAETIEPSFKPHSNNLQFVTLGQAMEAPNQTPSNHLTEINWSPSVNPPNNFNQQPVISTSNNGTTTYFINANGELYQANIPATTLQNPTIIVPTANTNQTFNKANIDNNENYMQQQQQPTQPQTHNNGQYIMLVNNLGGTPQYYATTHANLNQSVQTPATSTVLFHPNQARQVPNRPNYVTNATKQVHNTTTTNTTATETNSPKTTLVPITPNLEPSTQTIHQRINQQLQRQIKQRQLQLLQPRSPNVTQKITLICRFCHKRPKFTNNVDYSNHIINTHPAEKPYNCPHCPMHFTRRFERQQHVAQVHGSRYQCAQCGLSFCAQRTLDFHLQKYHANLGRSHHQQQQQQQQHLQQQNSTSTTTPAAAATYQLLQHNQQQRLVRVEDVHVQVTGENKNKRSIDLTLDGDADIQTSQSMPEVDLLSSSPGIQQHQQQQARKLGCPDCNGDNDDCCGSNKNHDQQQQHNNSNNIQQEVNLQQQQQQQYAGNESVNNHQQHPQHITIPSPEQTEPDSTTTLRHFRKRQLSELTPHFATSPSSSSSSSSSTSSSSSFNNNIISKNRAATNNNNNDNLNHNSPDNVLAGDVGSVVRGDNGGEQIMVERSLRGTHNCLLCEESFTNEIALRKHHHLAHGAAQSTINTAATSSALVCAICKRSFRMRNALQRHMETHDAEGRPYECNICQVRFPRPSQLTLHKLTVHKFEKPNTCEECGKQFGTESAMKAHAKEHEEAGSLTASSASDTSTLSSSSSSPPSEISSRIYLETMTTKTTSISTSTSSIATITKNEQNINLQSTTSGEVCSSASNAITTNNDNNTVAVYNIATQNTIVSGLST